MQRQLTVGKLALKCADREEMAPSCMQPMAVATPRSAARVRVRPGHPCTAMWAVTSASIRHHFPVQTHNACMSAEYADVVNVKYVKCMIVCSNKRVCLLKSCMSGANTEVLAG